MRRIKPATILGLILVLGLSGSAMARQTAYEAMGVEPKDVLAGTVLTARVVEGKAKQVICVASYMTGKKSEAEAVNVKLGVFDRVGETLVQRYVRDFGAEQGGFVANGDLQLVDLDRDDVNEIVVTFDDFSDRLIEQTLGEIIVRDGDGFRSAWRGPMVYDATKAARDLPRERRDRFVRELDIASTMRSRGVTLFFHKKVVAIAGERLAEPKIVQETFPLKARANP